MKIEVLFPEICNLYGELENIGYLRKSMPDIEVIETAITDEPLFASEKPDLIYMGTMTESAQILVIEKLLQYRDRIKALIESGANFLITGNALEVFGKKIVDVDGTVIDGLGMFDFTTKRDMMNRFNSLYLGEFSAQTGDAAAKMKIVGYKSQFTHSYWKDSSSGAEAAESKSAAPAESGTAEAPLFITDRGPGLNPDIDGEGIHVGNFMATYVIGPLLILNPPFAKYILRLCGAENPQLAFEEAAMDAYEARVAEYSDPGTGFYY